MGDDIGKSTKGITDSTIGHVYVCALKLSQCLIDLRGTRVTPDIPLTSGQLLNNFSHNYVFV
jgi:hypothetical protein